jgi:hypothetical protein
MAAMRVLRIDDCDLSWRQPRQERENFRHQRQGFIKLGATGHQHHHRDLKFGGVLLKAQVAVGGRAYAKHAEVTVPSLDDWEKDWQENPQRSVQPKLVPVDFRSPLAAGAQSN